MKHATDKRLAHLEGSGYKVAEGDPDVRGWDVMDRDGQRIGEVDDLLVDPEALKVRYLEVRLDRRLVRETSAGESTGWSEERRRTEWPLDPDDPLSPTTEGLPELDPMSGDGEVIGHVAVPSETTAPVVPAATVGEVLVRGSLSDLENRMTIEDQPGEQPYLGERHILIPVGRARLDTGGDLVLVDFLTAEQAAEMPPYERGALKDGYEERIRSAFGATSPSAPETDPYEHDLYDERSFYGSRRAAK